MSLTKWKESNPGGEWFQRQNAIDIISTIFDIQRIDTRANRTLPGRVFTLNACYTNMRTRSNENHAGLAGAFVVVDAVNRCKRPSQWCETICWMWWTTRFRLQPKRVRSGGQGLCVCEEKVLHRSKKIEISLNGHDKLEHGKIRRKEKCVDPNELRIQSNDGLGEGKTSLWNGRYWSKWINKHYK